MSSVIAASTGNTIGAGSTATRGAFRAECRGSRLSGSRSSKSPPHGLQTSADHRLVRSPLPPLCSSPAPCIHWPCYLFESNRSYSNLPHRKNKKAVRSAEIRENHAKRQPRTAEKDVSSPPSHPASFPFRFRERFEDAARTLPELPRAELASARRPRGNHMPLALRGPDQIRDGNPPSTWNVTVAPARAASTARPSRCSPDPIHKPPPNPRFGYTGFHGRRNFLATHVPLRPGSPDRRAPDINTLRCLPTSITSSQRPSTYGLPGAPRVPPNAAFSKSGGGSRKEAGA